MAPPSQLSTLFSDLRVTVPTRVALVTTAWHSGHMDQLVRHVEEAARQQPVQMTVDRFVAPGTWELPRLVKGLVSSYDLILPMGILLHGETRHASIIEDAVGSALMTLGLAGRAVVINGILSLPAQDHERLLVDRYVSSRSWFLSGLALLQEEARVRQVVQQELTSEADEPDEWDESDE